MKSCVAWYPVMLMLAIDFAFAITNVLLKKIIIDGMNHLVFITYRQSISTIFLAPVAFFVERNTRPKLTPRILCHLFLCAIVGASVTQYLFLIGVEYTSATFACAFLNIVPVVTFLMALPFGLEKISVRSSSGRAKVIGTLICLGGALLLTFYKGLPLVKFPPSEAVAVAETIRRVSSQRRERWIYGSLALFAGTLFWSSWFLLQSSVSKSYPCQYSSTVIMNFFSAIQSAVLTLCTDRSASIWIPAKKIDMANVVYTGLVSSGLCFVGMSWCVKKRGPVFTAAFSPLVQVMAAMVDVPVLHEQLHLGSVIGSVVVIIGLYILLWGKNKEIHKVGQEREDEKDTESAFQGVVEDNNCESRIP
ncbi:WAT1-related protein At3g30340-like [Ipomoea triloba]|uniref:WAT1-related protein At3g30340-like n=1 Tax=Ipomoea triloba TaxID=35885 RepID=UPI00125E26A1|nr:WAT1-related protein At3g30340-like [Ipomoea triloba]